jgi:cytoskeleton protein RodZ
LQNSALPADEQVVLEIDESSDIEATPEPIDSAVVAIESVDIEAEEELTTVVPEKLNMPSDVSGDYTFVRDSVSNSSETITGDLVEDPAEPNLIPTPPPPPTSTVSQEPPRVYGHENADSRVTLLARQDSWVQVQSAENQLLITRILYSGDSYLVPDLEGLTLITGNAGGLEILVDGESISPLGPEGAVRRNIPLEPNALRALAENERQ